MSLIQLIILIILLGVFFFFIAPYAILSFILYTKLLVRTSPEKWGRTCSIPEDEEYQRMFDLGMQWHETHKSCKSDLFVESDGFRLAAEYFDFGFRRAVIIVPGRMESCLYSYFFAEPYRKAGFNVLAIDNRSHGLSEGRRCALGLKEYRDLLRWAKLLHEEKQADSVIMHGICIGAAAGLTALVSEDCPDYLSGLVGEGMYTTFADSFKNHMIEDRRPLFPIFWATMQQIRIFSGVNVMKNGPVNQIAQLKKPILFLHSREDRFSLPEYADLLYEKCTAPKKLCWFPKGAHSRIRITSPESYDEAITAFLTEHFGS